MQSSGDTAGRLAGSGKSRGAAMWKSRFVRNVYSMIDESARTCQNARSRSRSLTHEACRVFTIQWQIWIRTTIIHVLPVAAALTIIVLNARGFFIGKQLQGSINQDGTKMLLLQITAKIHELLILASLGDILYSYLLYLLVYGDGAPLSALTAGEEFSDISYLWSEDFIATCRAKFSRKAVLICLVVVCTILGIVVGPSSATAMAPWRDGWTADQMGVSIDVSKEQLWPLTLSGTTLPEPLCSSESPVCGTDNVWASLLANLFSYWGESSYGNVRGMPEAVGITGPDAMRMMRVRFRGPISMYQPEFTVATVQPVSAARIVNGLRMIWSSDNAKKCSRRRNGYCDYEDINWSVDTMQPTVYVACMPVDLTQDLRFPTMNELKSSVAASSASIIMPSFTNASRVAAEAVQLDRNDFPRVSVGSFVRIKSEDRDFVYACSIDAQWSNSAVATTFLGSPYMVDGNAPDFFVPTAQGSTYQGQRVRIEPSWANMVLSGVDSTTNLTVLDSLYAGGGVPDPSEASEKIESIISVLMAENMARIESQAELDLGDAKTDLATLQWNEFRDLSATSARTQLLEFQVVVTGYGYGILNGRSVAVGPLLSVLVLIVYCSIVFVHFGVKLIQPRDAIEKWRSMIELLILALQTSLDPSLVKLAPQRSSSDDAMLRENVKIVQKGNQPGIVFVNLFGRNLRYQSISRDDGH